MSRVTAAIERHPRAAFGAFLLLHVLVWTALAALLYPNLPLDLIEALTYGREWQLGYDKLPPLPWWLIELVRKFIGADMGYYALAQLAVVGCFALVWLMARPLAGPIGAIVSVLIIDGIHYFHYTAAKFNHDVIQLPLWALAGYAFHAALRRGRILHWILLGLAIGSALWAKYFVVVLAAPLALFLVGDREARKSLKTPGPWLAIGVAFVVMGPHLLWLVQNDTFRLPTPTLAPPLRGGFSTTCFDHWPSPGDSWDSLPRRCSSARPCGVLGPAATPSAPALLPQRMTSTVGSSPCSPSAQRPQ